MFFRSEDDVQEWAEAAGRKACATIDLETAWQLARRWYGGLLSPSWRRRHPSEVRALFVGLGLTSSAWLGEAAERR